MAELYEDADITIVSGEDTITGKVLAIEQFEWETYSELFSPVYHLDKKYQIIGNTVGKLIMRGIEFPKTTEQDCYRIISENPVEITVSKDGEILRYIRQAYPDQRSLLQSPVAEGSQTTKNVLMEFLGFFILQ